MLIGEVSLFLERKEVRREEKERGRDRGRTELITVGLLSPSLIRNLDPVGDRGSAGEGASLAILFEHVPLVYPADVFDSRLQDDWIPVGSSPTKSQKIDFWGWRSAITFLHLFSFHSLVRLTSFLSRDKR